MSQLIESNATTAIAIPLEAYNSNDNLVIFENYDLWNQSIPENCETFFDGCNTCTVAGDGLSLLACTERACTSASCLPYCSAFKDSKQVPQNCIRWFDGCNTCDTTIIRSDYISSKTFLEFTSTSFKLEGEDCIQHHFNTG